MMKPFFADEQAERQERVDFARGNVQLEGFVLDAGTEHICERYVRGEIDGDEVIDLVLSSIQNEIFAHAKI